MTVVQMQSNIDPNYVRMLAAQGDMALLESFTVARPSVAERLAAGKALRTKVPRASHARYEKAADRPDPVAILEQQNVTRVQKLVPVRYARMLASPFAFLRGSAAVMACDLSNTPVTGMQVAACGDMHVANFGLYASAERNLVFAINDFDEVYPGPWEWDLKRLATSGAVAVRFMGGDKDDAVAAARAIVRSYRRHIRQYAEMGYLQVWYEHINEGVILDALSRRERRGAERTMAAARAKGHIRTLEKMTNQVDGEHRIVEDAPLIVRETHVATGTRVDVALDHMLRAYLDSLPNDRRRLLSRYRIIDVARKVVGVGSVGSACWVILLQGVDGDDPLFLQVKEAQPSVLSPYVDTKIQVENQGQRVVVGQRLTQGSPDIFLGWGHTEGKDFYVRQLADMKGGVKFVGGRKEKLDDFDGYWGLCGWALALAHAKSGDPAMLSGYVGKSEELDEAMVSFGRAYADQTEQDYEMLQAAAAQGRIQVAEGDVV